jgi:hypothetical protein
LWLDANAWIGNLNNQDALQVCLFYVIIIISLSPIELRYVWSASIIYEIGSSVHAAKSSSESL